MRCQARTPESQSHDPCLPLRSSPARRQRPRGPTPSSCTVTLTPDTCCRRAGTPTRTIFKAELERIHQRAWHFATHTGDLQAPGDVYVRNVAGVPIVLVRDTDQSVRGFINICRHRGHPVVMSSGNQPKLRCYQHAWTYGLDGKLQQAPRSEGDPTFDPSQFGLVPIKTHVWGPMVWVNLEPRVTVVRRMGQGHARAAARARTRRQRPRVRF